MSLLLIQCPDTGHAVSTGVYLDEQVLTVEDVKHGVLRDCPACGGRHEYTDDDTFMDTDGE